VPKISKKAFKQLDYLIADVISLNKVTEFEDERELFKNPPALWDDIENQLCDYQGRISNELCDGIRKIFGGGINA
jgi:hypothetical protein